MNKKHLPLPAKSICFSAVHNQGSLNYRESQHVPSAVFRTFPREALDRSIPARFEKQVQEFPRRLALKTESVTYTYEELNYQANRIARMILAHKGSNTHPIGLIMETGGSMMASILGILKAGRFFIPVDPVLLSSRERHILYEAHTDLILTDHSTQAIARELGGDAIQLVNIDELDHSLSTNNLGLRISPDQLAYIIYTSGSTGQPKGVMQNHRNVLHKVMEHTNSVHLCHMDRLGLLYSPSFSGAMRDIFSALLNGAGLFPFDLKRGGVSRLADWLRDEEITVYNSAATVFRHLISCLTPTHSFPNLRLIQLGSETYLL